MRSFANHASRETCPSNAVFERPLCEVIARQLHPQAVRDKSADGILDVRLGNATELAALRVAQRFDQNCFSAIGDHEPRGQTDTSYLDSTPNVSH